MTLSVGASRGRAISTRVAAALLAIQSAISQRDVLIAQLNGFNTNTANTDGWALQYSTSSMLDPLPAPLTAMSYRSAIINGAAGWQPLGSSSWCLIQSSGTETCFHTNAPANCGTTAFGYCAPVVSWSARSGWNITRVRLTVVSKDSGDTDFSIYGDGRLAWTRTNTPIGSYEVLFNASNAALPSNISVRLDPRTGCYNDGNWVRIDVFGTAPPGACFASTLAGIGVSGASADGTAGVHARFTKPAGIGFLPGAGDLVAADQGNKVWIVFAGNGTVATYAGTGSLGYSGDLGGARAGALRMQAAP